jgi:hypothetical protein
MVSRFFRAVKVRGTADVQPNSLHANVCVYAIL